MSEVFSKIVDKLVDFFFSDAAKRTEAKRTKRNEIILILEQIWKSAEEIQMEIRKLYKHKASDKDKIRAQRTYIAKARKLNLFIAQNELYIDKAIYGMMQDYFSSLYALCDTVHQYGDEEDQEALADSAIRPLVDLGPLVAAYNEFNNKRNAIMSLLRQNITELSSK